MGKRPCNSPGPKNGVKEGALAIGEYMREPISQKDLGRKLGLNVNLLTMTNLKGSSRGYKEKLESLVKG